MGFQSGRWRMGRLCFTLRHARVAVFVFRYFISPVGEVEMLFVICVGMGCRYLVAASNYTRYGPLILP